MRRIGLVASKMAQGNLLKYNIFVVALSTLCATILLLASSISMLIILFIIGIILRFIMPAEFSGSWWGVIKIILVVFVALIAMLNVIAIVKNIRLTRPQS